MLIKCKVMIPNTTAAQDALNAVVLKILKAHGAEGNDYFEVCDEGETPDKQEVIDRDGPVDSDSEPKKRGRPPKSKEG